MRPRRDRREQCIQQLWRDLGAPDGSADRWTQQPQFEQQKDAQLREEWTLATPDDVGSATTVSHVLQDDLDTQAYPQVRTDVDTLQEQSDMTSGELPGGHWEGVEDAVVVKRRRATCAHAPELLGGHWEGVGDAVVVKRRPCSRAKAGISQPSSCKAGRPVAPGCTWLASLGRDGAYRAKVWIKGKEVSSGYFHAESGSLQARQEALNLAIQARAKARLRGQA